MKRREFMLAAGATTAGALLLPRTAFAAPGRIDWYTGSDSNILDFWTNTVKPAFEAANPDISINLVDAGDGSGMAAIAQRAIAAMETNKDPQADMFENHDPHIPDGAIDLGLWVNVREAGLENVDKVNPSAWQSDYRLPYRGSQVLLAYDTTKLDPANVPKNWEDLVAWIEANPGQFIYNRPDKGGSGGNFVRRVIHQVNGLDPDAFTLDNYTEEYAAETLQPAWDVLVDLAPSLYGEGAYTSGNTQSIQLLAQGVVTMTPVWSDQVLQAISQGVLPESTGLVQLQDLALVGGFSGMTFFTNGLNKEQALKLGDFMLTEEMQTAILTKIGGFPGVSWDYISPELREKFADIVPVSIPQFPSGPWEEAINNGWYRNVAPNVPRD